VIFDLSTYLGMSRLDWAELGLAILFWAMLWIADRQRVMKARIIALEQRVALLDQDLKP